LVKVQVQLPQPGKEVGAALFLSRVVAATKEVCVAQAFDEVVAEAEAGERAKPGAALGVEGGLRRRRRRMQNKKGKQT
jgi:hypothetical protein